MIETKIKEAPDKAEQFPAIYCTDDRGIVIIATEKMNGNTFAGVIVHPKEKFGQYSATWQFSKYRRMPSGSEYSLRFTQE